MTGNLQILIERVSDDRCLARLATAPATIASGPTEADALYALVKMFAGDPIELHFADHRANAPLPAAELEAHLTAGTAVAITEEGIKVAVTTGLNWQQAEAAMRSGRKVTTEALKAVRGWLQFDEPMLPHWALYQQLEGKPAVGPVPFPAKNTRPQDLAKMLGSKWEIVE